MRGSNGTPMRIYEPGSRGWKLKRFVTSTTQVPPISGIYVLSQLHTAEGLPISWDHVYVGQAKDLRRRLDQHTMRTEVRPELHRFMEVYHNSLWVWYTTDVAADALSDLEIVLIKQLRPSFNRRHNPDHPTPSPEE